MGSFVQRLVDIFENSPMGKVATSIVVVLFLTAAIYLAFGRDDGRASPGFRVLGFAGLLVLGLLVLTVLGFRLPF